MPTDQTKARRLFWKLFDAIGFKADADLLAEGRRHGYRIDTWSNGAVRMVKPPPHESKKRRPEDKVGYHYSRRNKGGRPCDKV